VGKCYTATQVRTRSESELFSNLNFKFKLVLLRTSQAMMNCQLNSGNFGIKILIHTITTTKYEAKSGPESLLHHMAWYLRRAHCILSPSLYMTSSLSPAPSCS
jgi:hypothetical protein